MTEHVGEEVSGSYDVVVVGGGIMGSCTAYEVAKRGKSVLLLEQYDFLHHRGSSHGESRTIRVAYREEYYAKWLHEGYGLWEAAERDAGYVVTRRTGHLDVGGRDDEQGTVQVMAACLRKLGVEHEVLSPEEVCARFPQVQIGAGEVGLYTAQGGVVRASKAVAMFQSLAAKHGATLRDHAPVEKVEAVSGGGVRVVTSRGCVWGRRCVVAAGAWTSKVVKGICGVELPIQGVHTTIAYWEVVGESGVVSAEQGLPAFSYHGRPLLYGTPSLEYPGLIKVCVHGGRACCPEERSLLPDVETAKKVVSPFVGSFFKGAVRWDAPVVAEACMYSMTPDEDFVLDWVAGSGDTILVAAGFSGHGFKFGPLVGSVMAELAICGTCTGVPLHHFRMQRFFDKPGGEAGNGCGTKAFDKQVDVVL